MSFESIRIDKEETGITTLWLTRAHKHNALCAQIMDELSSAAEYLDTCKQTRVVILAAEGPTFCAGGDLKWMQEQVDKDRFGKMEEAHRLAGRDARLPIVDAAPHLVDEHHHHDPSMISLLVSVEISTGFLGTSLQLFFPRD